MQILVDSFYSDNKSTLSLVSVDGEFQCFGLEDRAQVTKVPGQTRIPEGVYDIRVRTFGGFHQRYLNRYPWHRGMLELMHVPGFTDILIHVGNTHEDTQGCLLVGNSCSKSSVGNSVDAYQELYRKVIDAALANKLTISIVRSNV
jgi:hypothetical protein